jgi:hypothetical protein
MDRRTFWWEGDPTERFWCEITNREDLGADLKAPQANEDGRPYWSYSLMKEIRPGEVVFHYSTSETAFVGASIAGGPLEERAIVWAPQGTSARASRAARAPRPGWWLPLDQFRRAEAPLTLEELQRSEHQEWIRAWIDGAQERFGSSYAPLQPYPRLLRAAQGYITKMPKAFLERFQKLEELAASLRNATAESVDMRLPFEGEASFKSDAPYIARILGRVEVRRRDHETLVRFAAEHLKARGIGVSTPNPMDLWLGPPLDSIVEAKVIVGDEDPRFAIREAVGQLHEYRYFHSRPNARMAILLNRSPGPRLIRYVEEHLRMLILWREGSELAAGEQTQKALLKSLPV